MSSETTISDKACKEATFCKRKHIDEEDDDSNDKIIKAAMSSAARTKEQECISSVERIVAKARRVAMRAQARAASLGRLRNYMHEAKDDRPMFNALCKIIIDLDHESNDQ